MTRSTSSPLAVSMMIGTFDSARSVRQSDKSILARQHEIEEDEVDPAVGQDLLHGAAVRRRTDPEALLGQRARDEIANLAMVVDDQDVRRTLHFGNIDQRIAADFVEYVSDCGCRRV